MKTKLFTFAALLMFGLFSINVNAQTGNPVGSPNGGLPQGGGVKIQVKAYPNPAVEDLYIETQLPKQLVGNAQITITNSAGAVVYSYQCSDCADKYTHYVSTRDFSAGLYFVRLMYGTRISSCKFIKVDH